MDGEPCRVNAVDAKAIDRRSLRPFDLETVLESASKTSRVLTLEETGAPGESWQQSLIQGAALDE